MHPNLSGWPTPSPPRADRVIVMSAPPGLAADSRTTTSPVSREGNEGHYLSLPVLMREGQKVADALGLSVSHHRMSRIIRRFVREGRIDIDFRTWFIAYADPTGETAVRNVMRGRA